LAKNQTFEVLQRGVAASASRKIAVNLTFMRALGNWNKLFLVTFWINLV
jgi:hypothetical protein